MKINSMYYFSSGNIVSAFESIIGKTENKFWGLLSVLYSLDDTAQSGRTYKFDMSKGAVFLENIFRFYDKPKKVKETIRWVRFATDWIQLGRQIFIGKTPNILDVAIWAYRKRGFDSEHTSEEIVELFLKEFNIPLEMKSLWFFSGGERPIIYEYYVADDKEIASKLGVKITSPFTIICDESGSTAVASPSEISRGPFTQTLYSGQEVVSCMMMSTVNMDEFYVTVDAPLKNNEIRFVSTENLQDYRQFITAIKAKPFVLLAGISGTGKSRIVRQLAYATGGEDSRKVQKPFNYEMIPVRPNWHDSADLLGYVSRVSGKPEYIVTDFLRFLAKAWFYEKVPFFLCLDEMNLAPVEQYFAEFLSVTESRKLRDKQIVSDALIPPLSSFDKNVADAEKVSDQILKDLFHGFWVKDGWENNDVANRIEELKKQFRNEGISIPNNFIVMGTVNMDETTYSFSRKVLDRAMTIEMNIVELEAGLDLSKDALPSVSPEMILPMAVEGYDVYLGNEAICDQVIAYLKVVNRQLEGTPFKIGYRTRNEFLLYVLANLQFQSDSLGEKEVIDRALDEITFMKILSRIEGDKNKVGNVLTDLEAVIKESFPSLAENLQSVSLVKLGEMKGKLEKSFYCTFWS